MKRLFLIFLILFSFVAQGQSSQDRPIYGGNGGKVIISPKTSGGVSVPLIVADPALNKVTINATIEAPACDLGTTNTIVLDGISPLCKVQITGTATIDYTSISTGKQVTLVVINASGSNYTISTFTPTAKWRFGTIYNTVYANTHNIYTIMNVAGTYYIAAMDQMQ